VSILASAIITAAGSGLRFGLNIPKQLCPLMGGSILSRVVKVFLSHPSIAEIVLVVPKGQKEGFFSHLSSFLNMDELITLVEGGESRGESVLNGLKAISSEYVLVHDGARPLISPNDISRVLDAATIYGAAILATKLTDTLKRENQGFILETIPRDGLYLAKTPQAFRRELLEEAFAKGSPMSATDEASLVEKLGHKVKVLEGDPENIKITYPSDLDHAKSILLRRGESDPSATVLKDSQESLSVGSGWDFHRFAPGRDLYLGCVFFEGETGLMGHSDADVLSHALIDALLGASGLGDIGEYFPDSSSEFQGASGERLLGHTLGLITPAYKIVNVDLTLIGERPKIAPRRLEIREKLSSVLGINLSQINLKGKTTEGMGFLGRGEGLGASAVVLLKRLP
jgi:2-C-methyl-D-erythritol 4-phosphate cytidylyltransferase/2-C-methyl-D-erythritol 2,4-cyclodiphosphate synthase